MEGPNRKPGQQEGRRNVPFDRRGGRGSHFNSQDRRKPKPQQFKGTNKPKPKKGLNNRGHPQSHDNAGVRNHKASDNKFGLDGNADLDPTNNPNEHQRSQDNADIQKIQHEPHSRHGQSEAEHTSRKRSRQDESPERPEEPRRQEDDITPKLKRRQPHVAEAYRYGIRQHIIWLTCTNLFLVVDGELRYSPEICHFIGNLPPFSHMITHTR